MTGYEISLDHGNGLVRIMVNGEVDIHEGEKIVTRARIAAVENNYQLLYDVRNALVNVSISDWYQMARNLPVFKAVQAHHTRVAILLSPGDEDNGIKFYETTASNVGLVVRTFMDEDAAIEWLTGGKEGE